MNMIERMARQVAPTAFSGTYRSKVAQGAEKARAMATARRVLIAMREPTSAMADAGATAVDHMSANTRGVAANIWAKMIDAALTQTV